MIVTKVITYYSIATKIVLFEIYLLHVVVVASWLFALYFGCRRIQ